MSNHSNKTAAAAAAAQQAAAAKNRVQPQVEKTTEVEVPVVAAPAMSVVDKVQEPTVQDTVNVVDTSGTTESDGTDPAMAAGVRGVIAPPKPAVAVDLTPVKAPAMPKPISGLAMVSSTKVDMTLLDSEMDRLLADVPLPNRMQVNGIVEYIKRCDPSQMISIDGIAKASVGLWHNLRLIICNEDKYFQPVFTAALRAFELGSKGAMAEAYLYRAVDNMVLSAGDRRAFENITTMMRLLAPVKSRKAILANAIKLQRALRDGLTQEGINRVLAYFEE